MWLVILATAALIAALIAIAILGRRRDLANMGPPKESGNGRNGGGGSGNGGGSRTRSKGGTGLRAPWNPSLRR